MTQVMNPGMRIRTLNGRPLVATSMAEADDHMVAYGAREDSRAFELAPGQSATIEFSGVDDRLALSDGHHPRSIHYAIAEPGKYEVSFEYRYHRPSAGDAPSAASSERRDRIG
jgi:hypothetical protein